MDLDGKVALVTGGGRRVGRAIVEALAGRGASVAIHYHSSSSAAGKLRARLDRAATFQADLRDARAAEELPRRVAAELGRLDVVVNSASVMIRQELGSVTPDDWDLVHDTNLRAYFFVAQGAADALEAARGTLINISDLSAIEAWPAYIPHSSSKAGVDALTKGLARAMAPDVRVNAIAPGAVLLPDDWGQAEADEIIRTTPLRRLGSPADVVRAVEYLIDADYTTGTTLVVDGGRLLAPRTK